MHITNLEIEKYSCNLYMALKDDSKKHKNIEAAHLTHRIQDKERAHQAVEFKKAL